MVDNDPNSGQRARKRAIRARMRRTGESYVVAARRHDEEQHHLETRHLPVTRCPRCSVGLVEVDAIPECPACGATWESGAELAGEYAEVFLGLDWYSSIKDGGDAPTQECPECGEQAVVTVRPEDATFWTTMCLSCSAPWNDSCMRCGAPIQYRGEGDLLVCSACWQDAVQRD